MVAQDRVFEFVPRAWVAFEQFSVEHGRTSPVGLPAIVAPDAHAGSGGGLGLSRSIRRRISANTIHGTATSASLSNPGPAMTLGPGTDLDQRGPSHRIGPLSVLRPQGVTAVMIPDF